MARADHVSQQQTEFRGMCAAGKHNDTLAPLLLAHSGVDSPPRYELLGHTGVPLGEDGRCPRRPASKEGIE